MYFCCLQSSKKFMNTYYVLSTMGYMPASLKQDLLSAWRQQMKNFNSRLSEVQQNIS